MQESNHNVQDEGQAYRQPDDVRQTAPEKGQGNGDGAGQERRFKEPVTEGYPQQDEVTYLKVLLAHFSTILLPILFLCTARDRGNKYLRFYCVQALILWIVAAAGIFALCFLFGLLSLLWYGFLVVLTILVVLWSLFCAVLLLISAVKGYTGSIFRIPIIGTFAGKQLK